MEQVEFSWWGWYRGPRCACGAPVRHAYQPNGSRALFHPEPSRTGQGAMLQTVGGDVFAVYDVPAAPGSARRQVGPRYALHVCPPKPKRQWLPDSIVDRLRAIREMLTEGLRPRDIARRTGCSPAAAYTQERRMLRAGLLYRYPHKLGRKLGEHQREPHQLPLF